MVKPTVPHIIISKQESWMVRRDLIPNAMPSRIDDHRDITQMLNGDSQKYHLFKLIEEKTVREVLYGLPQILSIDEIKHNLIQVGFKIISVARLHKKITETRIDMPIIPVQHVNTFQNSYNFNLNKLGHMTLQCHCCRQ